MVLKAGDRRIRQGQFRLSSINTMEKKKVIMNYNESIKVDSYRTGRVPAPGGRLSPGRGGIRPDRLATDGEKTL